LIHVSNFAEAERELSKGLAMDSYCYSCHFELGDLYLRTGKLELARENFQWAIRYFPEANSAAFISLVGIEEELGDRQVAQTVLNEGLRVFPEDAGLRKIQASAGSGFRR
jgi:tetratricopeptide (TPR) repeat protein